MPTKMELFWTFFLVAQFWIPESRIVEGPSTHPEGTCGPHSLLGFTGLQSHGRDSPGVLYRVVVMAVIEVWISPKRFYVLRLRKISVDHCPTKVNLWPILGPRHRLIMSTILNRGGIDLGHKNLLLLGL
jgi:hypothetical protein